jgi:hypothetical protein
MNRLIPVFRIFGLSSIVGFGILGVLCLFCSFGIIGIWVWPYALNSWLIYLGKTAKVLWWQGFLLGVFPPLGILGIMVAIVTWVAMLFLM